MTGLVLQVELALSVEELLPKRLRRYLITETRVIFPNRNLNIIEKLRFNVLALRVAGLIVRRTSQLPSILSL